MPIVKRDGSGSVVALIYLREEPVLESLAEQAEALSEPAPGETAEQAAEREAALATVQASRADLLAEVESRFGQEDASYVALGSEPPLDPPAAAEIPQELTDRNDRIAALVGKVSDDTATLEEIRELLRLERGL